MRARILAALLMTALAPPLGAQECGPARTALVLSGGGAKGLAHIGVLAVLDSLGIKPDLVVGTSMGAIVGALYASGYSARQIDSLARHLPMAEVVRPFRVVTPHAWDHRIPLLFLVRGRNGFTFQTGLVDETQPNARLNAAMLRGNLLARGRFDQLPVPFLAVATDLRDRSTVVLAEGDLARAVRASSAIPLVFPPVVVGDAVLVDGGLSANIPVAQARAAGAERVIVSDVTEHPSDTLDVESPLALADQVLGFLFRQPSAQLGAGDVFIRPDVQSLRSLDFGRETIELVLRRGRLAADSILPRARCLPRGSVSAPPVPRVLSGWSVTSGSTADSLVLARMLRLAPGRPLDPPRLRDRLVGLAAAESFRGVWLHPTGGPDSVRFDIEPIRAPTMVGGGGLAYDHELGGRAWAGLFDRRVFGTTLEGSALLSFGELQRELYATVQWHFDAGWTRLTPLATLRIRTEDVRRFDPEGNTLTPIGTSDGRATAGLELLAGEAWRIQLGGDAVVWGTDSTRGRGTGGGSLRVLREARGGPALAAEALVTAAFQSARLQSGWRWASGRWSLVPTLRAGWGRDLPPQWTFPLGGDEGFPGLHLGERRGSRELSGSLRVGHAIKGPIELRLLAAAGRAWTPGAADRDWLAGARLGIGADTPAGPVDLSYGAATTGRTALYLRLGQWF